MAAAMVPAAMEAMSAEAAAGAATGEAAGAAAATEAPVVAGGAAPAAPGGAAGGVNPTQFADQLTGGAGKKGMLADALDGGLSGLNGVGMNIIGNAAMKVASTIGGALMPGSSGGIQDPGDMSL